MSWKDWFKLASTLQGGNKALEKQGEDFDLVTDKAAQTVYQAMALHHSQRNNYRDIGSTCFPTSNAMTVYTMFKNRSNHFTIGQGDFLNDKQLDDTLIRDVERNMKRYKKEMVKAAGWWARLYHPKKVAAFWRWYFEKKIGGFKISIHGKNIKKMRKALDAGKLVVSNTRLTKAGHIIVVNGYFKDTGEFICNDPWGRWPYRTKDDKVLDAGKDVYYKPKMFKSWYMVFDYSE